MFFRINSFFPGLRLFDEENFERAPMILIEKALSYIAQSELRRLDKEAYPVSELGCLTASIAGVNAKNARISEGINPYGYLLKKQEANALLSKKAAKTVLSVNKQRAIPAWARSYIDWELINLCAE